MKPTVPPLALRTFVKVPTVKPWQIFVPLAIPNIVLTSDKLKVVGTDQVSIISLDGRYEIDKSAEFRFNPNQNHILRLLTVSGRLVIGKYYPVLGWVWVQ